MTTMSRKFAPVRAALAAGGLLLAVSTPGAAAAATSCPPARPVVTGPSVVNRLESYSISWTNVLVNRGSGQPDVFVVERSNDPTFSSGVEKLQPTTRTSATFEAPGGSPRTIYHRVGVQSWCTGGSPVRIDSVPLAIQVTDQCSAPVQLPAPVVSPAQPPAWTTYIVSWDTLGIGEPGPGGGVDGLRFRLRRTSPKEVKETLNDAGNAAFADEPGEYLYQVRTENICGDASPWSDAARVVVGATKTSALVVVSTPGALLAPAAGGGAPATSFVVRNVGSEGLDVVAKDAAGELEVTPSAFRLESGQSRTVGVTVTHALDPAAPLHARVSLSANKVALDVPIDAAVAAADAPAPVGWDDEAADIDREGRGLWRNLVNPGAAPATIVSTVSADWIVVSTKDGKAWDRPLAPGESRPVFVGVDRTKRRAAIGTEVGTVTVETAGHPGEAKALSVADDGPLVSTTVGPAVGGDLPPLYLMKSRLLFPSLPNAIDARRVGRYTSDVWLSNVDAVSPIQVLMTLTPNGEANTSSAIRQFQFSLGPGETRRFRNVVGTVFGFEGASSLDISSPAATLSATAMVNNKPITPLVAGRTAALDNAITGTILSNAEFGIEMRPVAAGEGANAFDPTHIVSGLFHDARWRTNLILRETTGNETVVRIRLFDRLGDPIAREGAPVDFELKVPALGSLQINDAELFPPEPLEGSVRAEVEFRQGVIDGFGRNRGAVVPFATVIDSGTQDASLRVGVSTRALSPLAQDSLPAQRALAKGLPWEGVPEPLLFPAVHATGAALASGVSPRWRTRVTLANVNQTEPRTVRLRFVDESGNLPPGTSATATVLVPQKWTLTLNDVLEGSFLVPSSANVWGSVVVDAVRQQGSDAWEYTWADVDVQTESYTADTDDPTRGEFRTGMEGYTYRHGYSSFQSNLGTVLIDGAEISTRYRTNLILHEVGGAPCTVTVALYQPGALVPIAMTNVSLAKGAYVSRELFRDVLKLEIDEIVDARVVVRQLDGDGVFMAFVSKINLVTGDPANVFLRPASAGTGR